MVDPIVSQPVYYTGRGSPEGRQEAQIGCKYIDLDTGLEYLKRTGSALSNTGWSVTINIGSFFGVANVTTLLTVPSPASVSIAIIAQPGSLGGVVEPRFLMFDPSSNAASDPPNVYVPNDGGPGRWLIFMQ